MSDIELILEYRNGNSDALNKLIKGFSNKMKSLSFKWCKAANKVFLERCDLEQEGWIAFTEAVKKYEIREGICGKQSNCYFSSYASTAVEFSMRSIIRDNRPMGYKTTRCEERMVVIHSLDMPIDSDDGEQSWHDVIGDNSSEIPFLDIEGKNDIFILRNDLLHVLDAVLGGNIVDKKFISNEALIKSIKMRIYAKDLLLLRYGLYGKPMSIKEIADATGYTTTYLDDVMSNALWKIRNSSLGKQLMLLYDYPLKLKDDKEMLNQYKNPEKVIFQLHDIEELIKKFVG